ncbi:hypothetical protein [Nocardia arthritidis]|uniref:Uncharacterized protein n=1 Tax=Nocardia arthritidis TaxID=228602 RepID=A0A6G9YFC8_9NOCA|nr:hypothetical protein [Nocardia arthritidis]QIS11929.1 hypothetical protein F5544_20320 [Nocardia arthritidis]
MFSDSDKAQALVFLDLLTAHARTLARDIYQAEKCSRMEYSQALRYELGTVRACIDRIHRRFPETAQQSVPG